MSFLVDPPWLFANGEAYARVTRRPTYDGAVATGVVTLFWAVSVSLYLNARWTRPLWPLLPGRDGRDFMVNFPGLSLNTRRAGRRLHAIAVAVFATYPLWFWLGLAQGRRADRA